METEIVCTETKRFSGILENTANVPKTSKTYKPIFLNDGQVHALGKIAAFCQRSDLPTTPEENFFLLRGFAGTGKTFLIGELQKLFKKVFVFTAPTNKAVKVLRDTARAKSVLGENEKDGNFLTIHSLLGLRMTPQGTKKILTRGMHKTKIGEYKPAVIVVDEESMINAELFQFILDSAKLHPQIKWIFLGDSYQLPPVGEAESPVYKALGELPPNTCDTNFAKLTQSMRFGGDIALLSERIRFLIDRPLANVGDLKKYLFSGLVPEVVTLLPESGFWKESQNHLESFAKGEVKSLAWRNKTCDANNTSLRISVNNGVLGNRGKLLQEFEIGERIVLTAPAMSVVTVKDDDGEEKTITEIIASTDDEGIIEELSEGKLQDLDVWKIRLRLDDDNGYVNLVVVKSTCEKRFKARLKELADACNTNSKLWKNYWNFREQFHEISHAYAITVHRSQGSTYDKVFVNLLDILRNPNRTEAFKCLNVAVTRAKTQVFILV